MNQKLYGSALQLGITAEFIYASDLTIRSTIKNEEEEEEEKVEGGAISNLYGVLLARHRYSPEVKTKGLRGSRLVVMTSEQSHFSITRAAAILGIGTDHVIYIKCHDK
ncbi:glutamate decarboxylase [Elysia marginata]|uniref:Glutamate decarboxylase n=1 Tax=Elysia marginata TaxID=1093978 RepID=A0AAV4J5F8_9GAST|nr:glutamate decarboxylase [Elysia marginata]